MKSNKATKRGNCGVSNKILKADMRVLLSIPQQPTNKLLSQHLKINKGYVSRLTTTLESKGLIKHLFEFNVKKFSLTKQGVDVCCQFLAISEATSVKQLPLRNHDLRWSAKIIRKPKNIEKQLKEENWVESTPRNWKQYTFKEKEITILFNPNTLQFLPRDFYSSSVGEARHYQLKIIRNTISYLEDKYKGLKIGEPECVLAKLKKQSIARLYDPLSLEFYQTSTKQGQKITYFGENIDIDFSKGIPETEFKHKAKAPEHLLESANLFDNWFKNPITPQQIMDFVLKSHAQTLKTQNMLEKNIKEHNKLMKHINKAVNKLNKIEKQKKRYNAQMQQRSLEKWI